MWQPPPRFITKSRSHEAYEDPRRTAWTDFVFIVFLRDFVKSRRDAARAVSALSTPPAGAGPPRSCLHSAGPPVPAPGRTAGGYPGTCDASPVHRDART